MQPQGGESRQWHQGLRPPGTGLSAARLDRRTQVQACMQACICTFAPRGGAGGNVSQVETDLSKMAESGRARAKAARNHSKIGRNRDKLVELARTWPKSPRPWPNSSESDRCRRTFAEIAPELAHFGRNRPSLPQTDQNRSPLDKILESSGLGQIWTDELGTSPMTNLGELQI